MAKTGDKKHWLDLKDDENQRALRDRLGGTAPLICVYVILIVFAVTFLWPIIWLFFSSFKTNQELTVNPWWFPIAPTIENYINVWNAANFDKYVINSAVSSIVSVVITMFCSSTIAYIVARKKFKFKKLYFYYIIAGMMIPMHCIVIPIYLNTLEWGMHNNLLMLGLIYAAFRIPFSVFILESMMSGIPNEIEECATIDGCSSWGCFLKIIIPLSRDGLITVGVLAMTSAWNELLVASLLLNNPMAKTISIGLKSFVSEFSYEYGQLFAALFLACIPGLLVYAIAQGKMVKGLTMGAVKG